MTGTIVALLVLRLCVSLFPLQGASAWTSTFSTSPRPIPPTALKALLTEPEVEVETLKQEPVVEEKESTTVAPQQVSPLPARALAVSSEIELPFPAEVAFDAFADLKRQPEWSPWLHSVEYIDIGNDNPTDRAATKWTLRVLGVSYSWISVATNSNRPYLIEWESISGLKNFGQVEFEPLPQGTTHMTMTMTFVPPRLVAAFFRNSQGVQHFMERKLIGSSLSLFRDVIVEETTLASNTTMLFLPI